MPFARLFARSAGSRVPSIVPLVGGSTRGFIGAGALAAGVVTVAVSTAESSGFSLPTKKESDVMYAYKGAPKPPKDAAAAEAATAASLPKPKVLFVLGGPGAGKGTQCARLVEDYGFVHLSAGDLLRAERDSGSPDGEMITQFINEGKIVPVEVTVNLIKKAMTASGGSKFLVDGFPRNQNNLEGWFTTMGNEAEVEGVLFYDCPEAVMEARLVNRGKTSGRSDDNVEVIKKRFSTYVKETMPVIAFFGGQGKVHRIVADKGVDDVYAETRAAVAPMVARDVLAHNQALLDACHAGDWATYAKLSGADMTAIEAESNYAVVRGLDFHKYYFDLAGSAARAHPGSPRSASTIANPDVRLLSPKAAVVAYDRIVQKPDGSSASYGETRVWELRGGRWQQVHFHRTPQPSLAKQ